MPPARRFSTGGRVLAALACAALAMPAAASAQPQLLAPLGSGLTGPAGLAHTTDGSLWVADHTRGICRVDWTPAPRPVDSPWCMPGEEAHRAPVDPTGLAFDASTGNLYASDGASSGGAIWRLHVDEATATIDEATQIASLPDDRITAMTLMPGDGAGAPLDVVYVTRGSAAVWRVPASAGDAQSPVTVGFPVREAVGGMAYVDGGLFLGERDGVTRLGVRKGDPTTAAPVAALTGVPAAALAADASRGRLYVATMNDADLTSGVEVLDLATGRSEPYERGFTGATAITVDRDGSVLVADDPADATDAIDSFDQGRLWRVALEPLGRPATRITAAPPAAGASTVASFAYTSTDEAQFACRLDDREWAPCPGTGTGTMRYEDLGEGVHRFWVRARTETVTGVAVGRTFVVDRTAPRVTIEPPTAPFIRGGAARLRFWVDEHYASYSCGLDGGALAPCRPETPILGLTSGKHLLRVVAVDLAGNVGEATVGFQVRDPDPVPAASQPDAPTTPQPPASAPPLAAEPVIVVRADSATSPREKSPTLLPFRVRPGRVLHAPPTKLRFDIAAPSNATWAGLRIQDQRGRTVLSRVVRVSGGRNRFGIELRRSERRKLRGGLYLVSAVLGTAGGTIGNVQTHWLRVFPQR